MNFLLKLAGRNVTRQISRTTLSMVSIIAGVAVIIASRGLIRGLNENIVRAQIDAVSGHLVATPADYPTAGVQHPIDHLLELSPPATEWLNKNTVTWTRRVMFSPKAIKGRDAVRLRAFGYDPVTDEAVFPRDQWKVEGRIPDGAQEGVVISVGVARVLQLKVGDDLLLETRTVAGALNALALPVVGIVRTGNLIVDRLGIFVPAQTVQALLRSGSLHSHLCVRLQDRGEADAAAVELRRALGEGARVRTWAQEAEAMLQVQSIRQRVMDMIALAILAIAAAGIANTVLMAAYERTREIGTLRAMGMTRGAIVALFMIEGLLIGAGGGAIGGLLGGALVYHYSEKGVDLSGFLEGAGEAAESLSFSATLYLEHSPSTIAWAVAFGVVIAAAASVYPALLASRLEPADAVRG